MLDEERMLNKIDFGNNSYKATETEFKFTK